MLCRNCGSAFETTEPRRRNCDDCRDRYHSNYNRQYYLKHKDDPAFKARRKTVMREYNRRRKARLDTVEKV